jgi:hypothetical protein
MKEAQEGFSVQTHRPLNKLIRRNTEGLTVAETGKLVDITDRMGPFIVVIKDSSHVQNVTLGVDNGTIWNGTLVSECPDMFSLHLPLKRRIWGVKEHLVYTPPSPEEAQEKTRQAEIMARTMEAATKEHRI